MKEKRFCVRLLVFILLLLGMIIGLVYCMDPFYHYHEPEYGTKLCLYTSVYQTPGVAKNFTYDSAIIGTSMTENIHTEWLNTQLGWNTVKLSYSGARSDDLKAILGEVYRSGNEVQHIVMDINDYQLTEEAWTAYTVRPSYLYDESMITDIQYLLNADVVVASVKRLLESKCTYQAQEAISYNMDTVYTWEDSQLFSKEIVLGITRDTIMSARETEVTQEEVDEKRAILIQRCEDNLKNILPFIEEHPETEFYIFYPPYSILYWEEKVLTKSDDIIIEVYQKSIETLLQYENVKLYYYQDREEIITNLELYRDECHHAPEINKQIIQWMIEDEGRLRKDNYYIYLQHMKEIIKNYDYAQNWR